jgi:hypothetical protein
VLATSIHQVVWLMVLVLWISVLWIERWVVDLLG